jgi:xanthine dehydrogenase accessory factor
MAEETDACAVAHGHGPQAATLTSSAASSRPDSPAERQLVAVFASPVSGYLLRYAADAGYRTLLVEPDGSRADGAKMAGFTVAGQMPEDLDGADVVVTDHHRDELGVLLRDALGAKARWIGIIGKPGIVGPHVAALESLGVAPGDIARVHRPIGLNIGSRTPPEIAVSTLAGLIADRNSRPGGFVFAGA